MTQETLFSDLAAGDRLARTEYIDRTVEELLCRYPVTGAPGMVLTEQEKTVLRAIRYHRGAQNAVSIREITNLAKIEAREVKNIVRTLRCNFHLPIGSSKHATKGGYFIIVTREDQAIFDSDFLGQIRAQVDAHRAVSGPHRTRELLGQLQMEIG